MADSEELPLPALRDDLQLQPGPTSADGSPSWTIYDPVRGRYFRIGWAAFQMLSRWSAGNSERLLQQIHDATTCRLDSADVREFLRFLFSNNLTVAAIGNDYQAYLQQYRASRPPWYRQIVHHYLFFRVPLLKPDPFLRKTLPYLRWCFDSRLLYLLLLLGLAGLYLASRQWDSFRSTFLFFFDWQGALFYGVALLFSKLFHELGHAYTAVRYGCRVPVIGLAFMALLPMPYTDVTDAWRLPSRRQRLSIGAAGILVELALAVLSTLAWSFLPDGPLRSAAFILATTTWLTTLSINLSPFMRFDGYYMLSDLWGVDNLQPRAFALARWQLRRSLLAADLPKPEYLPLPLQRKLVVYAVVTWLYRLVIFTGLAVMVYQLFFKVLGLILFSVEIVWFIVRPLANELREWRSLQAQGLPGRAQKIGMGLAMASAMLLFVPWHDSVRLPAVLEAERHTVLFAPEAGQIAEIMVKPDQQVDAGQILLQLHSPKLDDAIALSEKRLAYYRLRLERAATTREASIDMRVSMQQWSVESARLAGLKQQRDRLQIRAQFAGVVTDLAYDLHPQRWVDPQQPLLTLVAPGRSIVRAISDEDAINVLAVGQRGRFVAEDATQANRAVTVASIGNLNLRELDSAYFASTYQGAVAVRSEAAGKWLPTHSVFPVRLEVTENGTASQVLRGTVIIEATPRSFGRRIVDGMIALFIRESGF